ncbi:MAG: M15 family metallopeptidase [Acidimicrobiales bacterium]|nr:M15 family metallopeptidase [Acidimicrobiales bacterium]
MRRTVLATLLFVVGGLSACDPTTGSPPAPGEDAPPYRVHVEPVTAADLGSSYEPGCPVGPEALRRVRVDYWGYDGEVHRGDLIVAASVADDVGWAFGELYDARFQIRRIHPVARYGGDDDASMAANNTSAFNCRRVTGGSGWSEHAYGTAIDINPIQNPYVSSGGTVLPSEGEIWADRSLRVPGMIHRNGVVVRTFTGLGWGWGGDWTSLKDYQHLSLSGG